MAEYSSTFAMAAARKAQATSNMFAHIEKVVLWIFGTEKCDLNMGISWLGKRELWVVCLDKVIRIC
ncbi:uncharacterized protein PHALS_13054 [Plasmopara halstedii]|uniref:Uncharacterized protein n=1 Tax=Plasmopara halstedii TaxID=4781 RepID=A0A0P1ANT8_PLAHL|nr:uncharacterized protein PHALS_13054 [Plasmopara halstedii]CEG42809.1 hypothetical protein PHALS_13054 [Plasmopara halstedii]|eukprot:XP_024579178.1 hypothetical protein PHALS_13054 [Plasmopara halstedii]